MAGPLLETKLHVPRRRQTLVPRPRLSERLSRGTESALTLVSAPAGFGKTTLLAQWLAAVPADGPSVAWLSLDQRDNDPALFWTYVVAALRVAAPGLGAGALSLLESPQPPIDAVLTALVNDLHAVSGDVVLVLEDYHVIEARDIQDGVAFLLEHLPPQAHLVIASRSDPELPLALLRGRGELVEVRAADLRFTPEEATAYLNGVMGLVLSAGDVTALEGRTEGWIAALQLAALSMQGRDDAASFIAGFAGDDRYIVDYLAEEVLQRQPEQVQRFLLQTSILDRLSGSLCDAVTGQDDGKARLAALERGNLFLVPLDDRRHWYRYHQLFADVLQAHLLDEQPDVVPELHRRASAWHERNGEPSEAIRHALAAEDVERAADLVELAIPALRKNRQEAAILRWLPRLPDEVVRARPVLTIGFVGALMASGDFQGVEDRLRDAERCLDSTPGSGRPADAPSAGMVVVDLEELPRLPAAIQMYRAALALVRGDAPATLRHAQVAIDLAADEDHVIRAAASALSGLALWGGGELEAAHRAYSASLEGLQRAGHISDVLGCSITLADIRTTQGRLGDALRTFEQALRLAADQPGTVLRGTADMYVGLSQIACERGDLPAAAQHLLRSQELGEHTGLPQNRYRWRVAMARVREAHGDVGGALSLLDEAQRVYMGDFSPNVRPVPASRARVLVALGRVGEALAWARDHALSAEDDLSYVREFEHITLARVLLAQYATERDQDSLHGATRLLERLLSAAEAGGRTGSVIEVLVLLALARHARGDTAGSLAPLERALSLAEPEGYVRVFVGEGPPMALLLRAIAKQRGTSDYVHRLRGACGQDRGTNPVPPATRPRQGIVEPLSDRELDVLRLLATDLDGPDIARSLTVSLNTMRTHTKSIYAKLGVNSRRAAVRRAEELDLLSRTRDR